MGGGAGVYVAVHRGGHDASIYGRALSSNTEKAVDRGGENGCGASGGGGDDDVGGGGCCCCGRRRR